MPFDNTPEGRLALADLSWRLRNPETWPVGFVWDYSDCNRCAMGLAWRLSGGQKPFGVMPDMNTVVRITSAVLADAEAADYPVLREIFLRLHSKLKVDVTAVAPEHVADAIDQYLAQRVLA